MFYIQVGEIAADALATRRVVLHIPGRDRDVRIGTEFDGRNIVVHDLLELHEELTALRIVGGNGGRLE
ncbi:hypothetical protein [Paraburkholderia graminis]|uniref:hypothetical protein n=1 Tax=Paraburkholderia graminis TaxID=60548 RepID=UPI0038B8A733